MLYDMIPYVEYAPLQSYTVIFYVLTPKRSRTEETVRANSASDARNIIYGKFGKDNVQIISVKKNSK